MQVLTIRSVYAKTAVVVRTFKVNTRTLLLRLHLYLCLLLLSREELIIGLMGNLSHLVHEELLWIVHVVARHEVRSLVKYGLLHIDLDHRNLLMRCLRLLLLMTHRDLRLLLLRVPHRRLRLLLLWMTHSHLTLWYLLKRWHVSEAECSHR